MHRQRLEVLKIRGQDEPARLGKGYDQRIDSRTAVSKPSQSGSAPCKGFRNSLDDIASLQESVLSGVTTSMAFETLDENGRQNFRRPKPPVAKHGNESQGLS